MGRMALLPGGLPVGDGRVWRQRWKSGLLDIWKRKPKLVGECLMALRSGWKVLASTSGLNGQKFSCCFLGELSNPRSWGVYAPGTIPALPWVYLPWLLRFSQTPGAWNLLIEVFCTHCQPLLHCGQWPSLCPMPLSTRLAFGACCSSRDFASRGRHLGRDVPPCLSPSQHSLLPSLSH